jgi:glycine cleavage system H protein
MANIPADLKYTRTHEWVRISGTVAEVGITDFAQNQLSDVTYVELPEVHKKLETGKEACTVESIKAASDIYAPLSGTVIEINSTLSSNPEIVNSDPYGKGWLFKIKIENQSELANLLSANAYEAIVKAGH